MSNFELSSRPKLGDNMVMAIEFANITTVFSRRAQDIAVAEIQSFDRRENRCVLDQFCFVHLVGFTRRGIGRL